MLINKEMDKNHIGYPSEIPEAEGGFLEIF